MTGKTEDQAFIGGLVIAAVCDIRGFTEMTSTVDAINQSHQVPNKIKNDLLGDYANVVKSTQRLAVDVLLAPFISEQERVREVYNSDFDRDLNNQVCSLKSTGDGFLIALDATRSTRKPDSIDFQLVIAELMFRGLAELVNSSSLGNFNDDLNSFLEMWEPYLALAHADRKARHGGYNTKVAPKRKEKDSLWEITYPGYLRLAGAIALGTGQLVEDPYPRNELLPDRADAIFDVRADAYGHGVNMAFRICDRAGRKDTKGPGRDDTPFLLIDRRIGQLLIEMDSGSGKYRMTRFPGLALSRVKFENPLKGIDELWCYGVTMVKAIDSDKGAGKKGKGGPERNIRG